MPIRCALQGPGADARFPSKYAKLSTCVLVVVCAMTLAGCDYAGRDLKLSHTVPLPNRALLKPQPEPNCERETVELKTEELRKLDYERQCYRHAEMIARDRLDLLQGSVAKTIKAIQRRERGDL